MDPSYRFCPMVRAWMRLSSPSRVSRALEHPDDTLAYWQRLDRHINFALSLLLFSLLIGPALVMEQYYPEAGKLFLLIIAGGGVCSGLVFAFSRYLGFNKATLTRRSQLFGMTPAVSGFLSLGDQCRWEMEAQFLLYQPEGRALLQQRTLESGTAPARPAAPATARRL